MKKIKVLMLGRYDFHQKVGGVQYYASTIIDNLSSEVVIDSVVSSEKSLGDSLALPSGRMWRMGTLCTVASTPISLFYPFKIWSLVGKGNYDIIHFNFPDPLSLVTFLLLKKRNVKYILSWHSDVVKQKWAFKIYLPLLKVFLDRIDLFLVATKSHFTSSTQLPSKYAEKVVVVPYGVPSPPQLEILAPEAILQNENRKIILGVGRHVYYKGFEYLIEAMKQVDNAVLVLVGKGPLTPIYEQLIEKYNLQDRVILAGLLSDQDLLGCFKHCDVFCLSSVEPSEAFGYVQVEAMRFGKPVVNFQLGNGVNEVCADGISGLTAELRNSKDLALKLNRLLSDAQLYKKLSVGAADRAKDFSMEKLKENIFRIYSSVIKNF